MLRKDALIFIIVALVILLSALWILLDHSREIERRVMEVRYEIGDRTGFNVEAEVLNFGRLIPGSSATRSLALNNTYDFPIYVELTGDSANPKLLIFDTSRMRVEPAEVLNIPVTLVVLDNMGVGNYSSFVVVHILK